MSLFSRRWRPWGSPNVPLRDHAQIIPFTLKIGVKPKPRIRIRADGWIRHRPGPFPFYPKTVVETIHADGLELVGQNAEYAGFWHESWWRGEADSWRRRGLPLDPDA